MLKEGVDGRCRGEDQVIRNGARGGVVASLRRRTGLGSWVEWVSVDRGVDGGGALAVVERLLWWWWRWWWWWWCSGVLW